MDARTRLPSGSGARSDGTGAAIRPPLSRFLDLCHDEIAGDNSGAVASYIPELAKADPDHFGISVATTDGYVYEVGDSAVPFTIQSISKAFVFALALETVGAKRVENLIGVEPSGDAFNSIRLRADNRPFNPMVGGPKSLNRHREINHLAENARLFHVAHVAICSPLIPTISKHSRQLHATWMRHGEPNLGR